MKKILFILLVTWIYSNAILSQCLDLGIEFTTQAQIDNFKTNYPGCTHISGPVTISGPEITNLNGLNEVTRIGHLNIQSTSNLRTLEGLESLKEITLSFIYANSALQSLKGLDGLELVDFVLIIQENDSLVNLSGLNSLREAFSFHITTNRALESLNGLDELVYVNSLALEGNPLLTNLTGMPKLDSLGELQISNHDNLLDLTGLESIHAIQKNVIIFRNPSLNSLNALSDLSYIGKNLEIYENPSLVSFDGLNSLAYIGGELVVRYNPLIQSFQGLNALEHIESNVDIRYNAALENLNGLEALQILKGIMYITDNDVLSSLSGLDNIDPQFIYHINLNHNPSLSYCAIESVCSYLANEENSQFIVDNDMGCNTADQVRNSCTVGVHHLDESAIQLFPNPTSGKLELLGDGLEDNIISVTDCQGRIVNDFFHHGNSMDLSNLPNGIYFISFLSENGRIIKRVVKGI